jgi:predicted aspartyl protease
MAQQQGPFDFVLDTGADTTIVDLSLAQRLSLAPLAIVQQTTLAGAQTLTRSSMGTLSLGTAMVERLQVLVQDLAELRKVDYHIEGIAGQDFLSHFNYLIDYQKHSLRIEQGAEIEAAITGDRVPIDVIENRMIVASKAQSSGDTKLHLLLDSGANSIVLIPAASQALRVQAQEHRSEATSSGQIGLQVGRLKVLMVGSQQFRGVTVALPAAAPAEQIGDGLLPTALFKALYVNNREGLVIFNPRDRKN